MHQEMTTGTRWQDEDNGIQRDDRGIERLIAEFAPLVRALAHRYEGRGVDAEDLRQEGAAGIVRLARRYGTGGARARIGRHLPGIVRDASMRMRDMSRRRRETTFVSLDAPCGAEADAPTFGELLADERAASDIDDAELRASLEMCLDGRDLETALMIASGASCASIAEASGVTRQAVVNRLKRMRGKLAGARAR